jgi:hypothetical protein
VSSVAEVRHAGRSLAEQLVAGIDVDLDAIAVEVDGTHADPVVLTKSASGARIADVQADASACAVQLVAPDGRRVLHRYFVTNRTVVRAVVQT